MDDVKEISLDVIDLSPPTMANPDSRKRETDKLIECFSTVGFCQISGIEDYDHNELFKWVKWFYHEVTEEERVDQLATTAFNPKNRNFYRGYFPLKEGALSYKQGYDIGNIIPEELEENGNPFMQKTPRLNLPGREEEVEAFYKVIVHFVSIVLIRLDFRIVY